MTPETVLSLSSKLLLISLVLGLIATFFSLRSSGEISDKLRRELSLANESAAKANERAEKIKKELSWRRLSEEQFNSLILGLRPFPSKLVITNPPEIESATFANDFVRAFTAAGWEVEYTPEAFFSYELKHGVFVSRTEDGTSDKLIEILRSIEVNPQLDAPEKELTLFVGSKPPPKVK